MYCSPKQFSGRQWDSECYLKNHLSLDLSYLCSNEILMLTFSNSDDVPLKRGLQAPICIIPQNSSVANNGILMYQKQDSDLYDFFDFFYKVWTFLYFCSNGNLMLMFIVICMMSCLKRSKKGTNIYTPPPPLIVQRQDCSAVQYQLPAANRLPGRCFMKQQAYVSSFRQQLMCLNLLHFFFLHPFHQVQQVCLSVHPEVSQCSRQNIIKSKNNMFVWLELLIV